jgi:uncharacterized integral membrane protein (TIGR00698 family)
MNKIKTNPLGIIFSVGLGLFVLVVSNYFTFFNSILLGLLVGMAIGNFIKIPSEFHSGINLTSSKMLEYSVIFLAFGINYTHIAKLGLQSFILITVVVLLVLLLTIYLSKKIKCPSSAGLLVGFGTAICGSSAIAALSPSLQKNKEDVGIALAVVNLYGTIGMLLLPFVLTTFNTTSFDSSILIGGTLHSVGNVAGAGFSMSQLIGEDAITIKLARIALLSPALILFNYISEHKTTKNWKQHLQLPWYLWSFLAITILVSLVDFDKSLLDIMNTMVKIVLTIAMTAIGLNVSIKSLIQSGKKGLFFGLIIFLIQIILVLVGLQFI